MDVEDVADELPEQLLTFDEVAQILGVRKDKASMLVHWAIGHYRISGKVRTSRRLVNQFLTLCDRSEA